MWASNLLLCAASELVILSCGMMLSGSIAAADIISGQALSGQDQADVDVVSSRRASQDREESKVEAYARLQEARIEIGGVYDNDDVTLMSPELDKDEALSCKHSRRHELLNQYSNASSHFIECAVFHAKPVLFCLQCVHEYERTLDAWKEITNDTDCSEDILVSDRLQIVSQTHSFLHQLWDDGLCERCYHEKDHKFYPSNTTTEFLNQYLRTMACFVENGGASKLLTGKETKKNLKFQTSPIPDTSNVTLCNNCSKIYCDLNKFYDSKDAEELCMDIIDLMNRTRMEWKESGCRIADKDFVSVVAISVFVCVLPVFFYLTAKLHGTKKQQRLVGRSRERRDQASGLSASARLYAGTTTTLR